MDSMLEYQRKESRMSGTSKSKGHIINKQTRALESVLHGKVATGDDFLVDKIRAVIYGTDNISNILAQKNKFRTFTTYVNSAGFDGAPCAILSSVFKSFFPKAIIIIENADSKGNMIRLDSCTEKGLSLIFALMEMCMVYGQRIRFYTIMGDAVFDSFRKVLQLLREYTLMDIKKESRNNIQGFISRLSQLKDSRLMFSRSKPKTLYSNS
jgi:hypothetical protein